MSKNWETQLRAYRSEHGSLFSDAFLARWGDQEWAPTATDKQAAGALHIELISRIATQPLGYSDGVEASALSSLHGLFEKTRSLSSNGSEGVHFEFCAWFVLNEIVRPFSAKWHPRQERGMLNALDTTDEFRAELTHVQSYLRLFDELLVDIRDGSRPSISVEPPRPSHLLTEFDRPLEWGVDTSAHDDCAAERAKAERQAINARRARYACTIPPERDRAAGLALSGGGIRSATFSLGVLSALSKRNLLPQFDYLSTVSGGGYLGAFLLSYLQSEQADSEAGLGKKQLPFRFERQESEILGLFRRNSRYLSAGSSWGRWQVGFAQTGGMAANLAVILALLGFVAAAEYAGRSFFSLPSTFTASVTVALAPLLLILAASFLVARLPSSSWNRADWFAGLAGLLSALLLTVLALSHLHMLLAGAAGAIPDTGRTLIIVAAPFALLVIAVLLERSFPGWRTPFRLLAQLSAPLFLLAAYLAGYAWIEAAFAAGYYKTLGACALVAAAVLFLLDINFTGLHRHYRDKLASAFMYHKPGEDASPASVKLSALCATTLPYPLINATLNAPSSTNPALRGRPADFFIMTPHYCGSASSGYAPTAAWETADPRLDLGTAMAISGAAASPQMGLHTDKRFSFWLALLNIRLGYWLENARKPASTWHWPRLLCLFREMFGRVHEKGPMLALSDGGHIENLGIYELLRRRCKFIVAVDGEQDPGMTFHAITNLQRLAYIDLGIRIDVNLDDFRLKPDGLSRSHFRICRINYGAGAHGYLLYLKLSLTGNEGEFLRRYKLDEPDFPHHSTADQFFTEPQFEAYRSLGEHVGDKLFLRSIVGDLADKSDINIDELFARIAESLLDPFAGARTP